MSIERVRIIQGPHTGPRASSAPRVRIGRKKTGRGSQEIRTCGIICYARIGVPRARRATAYLRPFKSAYVSGNSEAQRSERSLEHVNDPSSPVRGRDRKTDLYPRGRQLTSVLSNNTFLIVYLARRMYNFLCSSDCFVFINCRIKLSECGKHRKLELIDILYIELLDIENTGRRKKPVDTFTERAYRKASVS